MSDRAHASVSDHSLTVGARRFQAGVQAAVHDVEAHR
jgi:hypothetical protein